MNENLTVGEWFYREIDEFENAPADCRQTADGCALDAYLCPSNQWTIGDGCCFWEDGRPVQQDDTLPDDEHLPERRRKLLGFNAKYCEEYVRRHVTVPLTQNQFDVLCAFRFNTRETTLSGSSRLLPAINAQKWQDAAVAMTEFVYGSGSKRGPVKLPPKGWDVEKSGGQWWAIPPDHLTGAERIELGAEEKWYPYQDAHRGLLRRRLWGGLVFLNYDPRDVTKDNDVALPTKAKLLSTGVWRDSISTEGLTTLAHVRMRAKPLPPSELVLSTPIKAEPAVVPIASKAGQPVPLPGPVQAGPAIEKPASNGPASVAAGEGVKSLPPTTPAAPASLPAKVEVKPPEKLAPPPLPKDAAPASNEPKDLILSKRFWGLAITGIGTTNFLPRGVSEWINNEGNRELLTWLVVVVIGFALYKYGQRKAKTDLK
jgi:GH24 family phage-related lysozyme (muramidase)